MKLKSLFLATLAAMAMVSCSNENDPITDNGEQAEKNALLQFRISFGNSVNTRIDETDKQSGTEAGLNKEQTFSNALLIAAYVSESPQDVIIKDIERNEFLPVIKPEDLNSDPSSTGDYYQSVPFEVPEGTVKAYVVLNPKGLDIDITKNANGDITSIKNGDTEIKGKMTPDAVETVLKGMTLSVLPGTKIDEEDGEVPFVMYGASASATGEVLNPDETTAVSVTVDRVTAKLKEETPKKNLTASVSEDSEGESLVGGQTVSVTLTSYDFTNLAATSQLVYQGGKNFTAFNNELNGSDVPNLAYDNPLGAETYLDGKEQKPYYDEEGNVKPEAGITYCWENEKEGTTDNGDNITSIIYKGQITISGHEKGENVYVYNKKAYNYDELKTALPSLDLLDTGTIPEYEKRGIYKYEEGFCYYRQPIKTGDKSIIKRNNVYKLKVTSIGSIGYPTPIPPVKKTMMQLYITVNEWQVNVNNFTLGK